MRYAIGGRRPELAADAWVAPSADLIGSVRLAAGASVWFRVVLRGDSDWIDVGEGTNIQDGSVIHTDEGAPTRVGAGVTVGHMALLHSCTVGDESLIANGAVVLDRCVIGRHCIIAAGALVPPDRQIPDGSVVMGSPGRIVREVTERDLDAIRRAAANYRRRAQHYGESLRALSEADPAE